MLDGKALEAAIGCYSEGGCSGLDERERREVVSDIVSAYLSALLPEDAADLVAEMTSEDFRHEMQHLRSSSEIDMLFHRAASLIQSKAAESERWRAEYLNAASDAQKFAARIAELAAAIRGLLDCPDIADNDHKDEETHAAERTARSLLNGERKG